jgi:hypothetical protein
MGIKVNKKGVVNVLELTIVLITLFVSFSIFFPRADYKNRWEDAYTILKARDTILLLERAGNLHTYAFEPALIESFFETLFPESSLIVWTEIEGGIKSDIKIACDCTNDVIAELYDWVHGLKINERDITISFCSANLDSPDACIDESDAMIISSYRQLQPYEQMISDYISEGNGIIEVMDFEKQEEVDSDSVQTGIFGLRWVSLKMITMDYVEFPRDPNNATDVIHGPYKYFYHVPLPLKTLGDDGVIAGCDYSPTKIGNFTFKSTNYTFWVCNESSVWFDIDGNGVRDKLINERDNVTIGGYNFSLNYVNSDSSIAVSFKPDYVFDDFLAYIFPGGLEEIPPGDPGGIWRTLQIEPNDGDQERVLLTSISEIPARQYPAVILNQLGDSRVAWTASLGEGNVEDDEKALLISLLLWASNKHTTSEVSNLQFGYLTSFINVKNIDMFEVYKFSLGLGYPF